MPTKKELQEKLSAAETDAFVAKGEANKFKFENAKLQGNIIGLCKGMLLHELPETVKESLTETINQYS